MRVFFSFIVGERRLLAFGLFAAALSGFGQTFFVALFGAEIRAVFDLSHGAFGALYGVATLGSAATIIVVGRGVDRIDLRLYAVLVAFGLGAGAVAMAAAPGLVALLGALFLLRLCGQGLMMHMALTTMVRYFQQARGRAVGIAALGLPLAEAVLPGMAVAAGGVFGWRGVWVVVALFVALVAVPGLLWLLRGHGDRRRAHEARLAEAEAESGAVRSWRRAEVFADGRFYPVLMAAMAAPAVMTLIFFHQAHIAEQSGWTLEWVAVAFAAFATTHIAGLLGGGLLVDRWSARRILPLALLPLAGGLALLAVGKGDWVAPTYLALCGLGIGMTGTAGSAVWAELYGVAHIGGIRAVAHAAMVFSTAVSPPAAGVLFDVGVSVEAVAAVLAVAAVAVGAAALFAARRPAR